jgi:adenylate cyclase
MKRPFEEIENCIGPQVRLSIHCSPITAGVIGTQRMQYDVWGDTVNVASRMESTSEPGRIHVSEAFAHAVQQTITDAPFSIVKRGTVEIKGKGMMTTYWLEDV